MRVQRFFSAVAGFALLFVLPLSVAPSALADEDNDDEQAESSDVTFVTPTIEGVIYKIESREGAQVLTVYDRQVGQGGLGIQVYLRDPGLVSQVRNGAICVGKFVVVNGVRTSPSTMDGEGVWVDPTTRCGTPPGASS